MMGVGAYCCSSVDSPLPSSKMNCFGERVPFCFFGFGLGVMNRARRRPSMMRPVGCPSLSSSQWREGYSYGELRIGSLKKSTDTIITPLHHESFTNLAGNPYVIEVSWLHMWHMCNFLPVRGLSEVNSHRLQLDPQRES